MSTPDTENTSPGLVIGEISAETGGLSERSLLISASQRPKSWEYKRTFMLVRYGIMAPRYKLDAT